MRVCGHRGPPKRPKYRPPPPDDDDRDAMGRLSPQLQWTPNLPTQCLSPNFLFGSNIATGGLHEGVLVEEHSRLRRTNTFQPSSPANAVYPNWESDIVVEMQLQRRSSSTAKRIELNSQCNLVRSHLIGEDQVQHSKRANPEIWPGSFVRTQKLTCGIGCASAGRNVKVSSEDDSECAPRSTVGPPYNTATTKSHSIIASSTGKANFGDAYNTHVTDLVRWADRTLSKEVITLQESSRFPLLMAWFFLLPGPRGLESIPSILLYLFICFVGARYTYRAFFSPLAKFPGPRIAGVTKLYEAYHVLIKNDWLENLERLHKRYGPVVRIGPNELHFVDHKFCLEHHKRPDLLKCDNYYGLLNKLLGGLASPTKHIERAGAMRPIFSGQTLAQYTPTLDNHLESLHTRLCQVAGDDEAVNMTLHLWAFTNDVMISYLVEENYGFLRVFDLQAVHDSTRASSAIDLATVLRCMPPIKLMFDVFPALRSHSPLGWLDNLIKSHLRPIVKTWDDENSHEGILARMFNEVGNETLTVHESSQAIFIGNESLLSNLTFLIHHLIQHPEIVKKIRTELDTLDLGTYGHRVWRDPRVLQLKYLDAVCKEASRLSSPGWHRQPRQSLGTTIYQGMEIPAKTSMSFTLRLLELDADIYPEPNTFNPDRWLGFSDEAKASRNQAVMFGTGTRTCLGQHIAHRVLRKTIAGIVYNFNFSLWDEKVDRMEGYRYLDTYPKKGHEGYLKVRLTPRFSTSA